MTHKQLWTIRKMEPTDENSWVLFGPVLTGLTHAEARAERDRRRFQDMLRRHT